MCDRVVADLSARGELYHFCGEPIERKIEHIASCLRSDGTAAHPQLLGVIRGYLPTAKTLVVEHDYYDLDYRSEFTATHETSFSVREPSAGRMHFFSASAKAPTLGLRRAIIEIKSSYIGYVVVRPQNPGVVGRSLITPFGSSASPKPQRLHEGLAYSGEDLGGYVRTAVTEWNELFGVSLRAFGVPFMEQDQHLLRCAHVSAWICHYTAVLRGFVPRQPSAAFHNAEDGTGAYGRRYPSSGCSRDTLSRILRKLDLPPEVLEQSTLEAPRRETFWSDRRAFIAGITPYLRDDSDSSVERRRKKEGQRPLVRRENLTSSVCRYLNSGIPVILASDIREHTRVICGYIRARDTTSSDASNDGVAAFILQDDQRPPFVVERVEAVLDDLEANRGVSLVVPLPRGVWLSGEAAESSGIALFEYFINNRMLGLAEFIKSQKLRRSAAHDLSQMYRRLGNAMQEKTSEFAIRSYVVRGSDFKISFARRTSDDAAELLGYTRLPKYVWIAEIIDRQRRRDQTAGGSVLGSIVLDASVVSSDAGRGMLAEQRALPLFVHVPGASARPVIPSEVISWTWCPPFSANSVDQFYYESGRWAHSSAVDWSSAVATSHAGKTALGA